MATRGVFQCQKLTLRYCEHGGSSRAVREYLASGRLVEWATERPSVEIRIQVANGRHPNLMADYATTSVSNKTAMNGVKSRPWWNHPVEAALDQLYNKSGRKMTKFTKPVYTQTPSIQGVWTPSLDLHLLPETDDCAFDLTIVTPPTAAAAASDSA
eukprot:jgi/Psemu1/178055/e_gw1.3.312.1